MLSFPLPISWIRIPLLLSKNAKTGDGVSIEFASGGKHYWACIAQGLLWSSSRFQVVTRFDQIVKQDTTANDLSSTDL